MSNGEGYTTTSGRRQGLFTGHAERRDYSNGFKSKRLRTRVGDLDLLIPQVRNSDFYPQALERGTRSERALKLSLAEMYVQGVSTRKVKAITEKLCGFEVSSSQVSRATAELDEHFKQWREAKDKSGEHISECTIIGAASDSSVDGDERGLAK